MHFHIVHRTEYRYSKPAFLEPHRIRLTPRGAGLQRTLRDTLRITPPPDGQSLTLSEEDNPVRCAWFSGLHPCLEVHVELEVETFRTDPFDYLPDAGSESLPIRLPPHAATRLAPDLDGGSDPRVRELAEQLARAADGRTLPFLDRLNQELYQTIRVEIREEGQPQPAQETLERRAGACRDLAVVFLEVCRSAGIPSRFVSGYQAGDPAQPHRYLHAWAEVFIPGGGWRGYDPTLGLAVADRHVALAASCSPEMTLPIQGSFRGDATCSMSSMLHISTT